MGRMRFARWITEAADTHSKYVILKTFPRQQWLRERVPLLSFRFIACHVSVDMVCECGCGGYCYGVVVSNLFIMVLCSFVYFCNVWGCVCVGFVLYGCVRLM